ncbi:phosphate ABC transporter substrate-binding protein [Veillonella sp. YH-vei2232]|uniref:Phosphate-binding protein n=1 Tax=Veillonella absiana TaxID=3079305 RepID=A0ABU3Z6T4_9FIRM|nr:MULTISPECIES: phosphate ABC transporter substrate-binding protein [unclassified Veillonella]MDV5063014.1 phosphate ABC transporter substrate-binding protein [Veillonella sp. YH-vei2232]MDV5087634.1 phosphate ABC transporter substrate-binding protein [Veillonella sp. YH-vei2233]
MKLNKMIAIGLMGVMTMGVIAGCGADTKKAEGGVPASKVTGTVTASGSSALLPLAKLAGDQFKAKNPDVSMTINGGGSGTGLKQVFDGTVTIGNSDVAAEEKLSPEQAKQLVDHKVAVVTMATVANKKIADTVKTLSKDQLKGIFTGQITNWSAVGGPDLPITLISRPATSGTRALFEKFALDGAKEATNKSLETDDSGALIQTIADNEGAIGYVALSYLGKSDKVAPIAIGGVAPTLENTYNGTYPVWGYEHMYTKGEAKDAAKSYLDFVVSDEFGKKIEEMGYGVTSKMKVSR